MCLRRNQTGETELNETEQTGKNCYESDDESCYTPHFSAEVDLIGIFLAFLIVVLNTMVFILVAKKRSLRTTTNNFLIGLAASDLLEGLIGLPLVITCNIFMEHGVCFSTIYVWLYTSFLTMSHIMAVTADRRGTQRQFSEKICSEDDLRSTIFGPFVVKFLACLPLLGFSNIYKMV